jgi:hypothetical protein
MPKKSFPEFVPPMMAESAKAPFDSSDWIFEIKLDGYRAITVFDAAGKPHLWSRNSLPERRSVLERVIKPLPGIPSLVNTSRPKERRSSSSRRKRGWKG